MSPNPEEQEHEPSDVQRWEYMIHSCFGALIAECHGTASEKGWWDVDEGDPTKIALMHSELSEALEALREGNPPDDKIPEYSGVEAELADVIIRIFDLAGKRGWDISGALIAKMQMNKGRSRMHGGKKF